MSLYGYPREPEPLDDEESLPPAAGGYAGTGVIPAQRPAFATEPVSPAELSGRHRSAGPQTNGHATGDEFAWLRPSDERPELGPSPMGQPMLGQPMLGQPMLGQPMMGQPLSAAPVSPTPVSPVPMPPDPTPARVPAPAHPAARPLVAPQAVPEPTTRISVPPPETEAALAALLDEPDVVPWDRRPLLIVIASAIVLVLIGVAAGVVSAAVAEPRGDRPGVSWQDPDSTPAAP